MKIYFAVSIRGGRDDVEIYKILINHLKNHGEVLSEHIGNLNLTNQGEELKETEIFKRDIKWINESDIIIAEVTKPSLGVGYEIALASTMGKNILCLFRPSEGNKLSAMIKVMENINIENYSNINEAIYIIDNFVRNYSKK